MKASEFVRDFELSVVRDCLSAEARERLIELLDAAMEETLAEEELGRLYSRPGHSSDEELIDANERVSRAYERRRQATWALT